MAKSKYRMDEAAVRRSANTRFAGIMGNDALSKRIGEYVASNGKDSHETTFGEHKIRCWPKKLTSQWSLVAVYSRTGNAKLIMIFHDNKFKLAYCRQDSAPVFDDMASYGLRASNF